jgi:CBS domain-containing protein/uncharacterized protein (DUF2267 family)
MALHEYQNSKTLVLAPDANAYQAARAMAERQLGSAVVVEHGRVAGIVTDRDLVLDVLARGADPQETKLRSIMRKSVVTIDVGASISEAVTLMRTNACRRIPILREGHVVGIVTLDDLLLDRVLASDAIASVVGSQLELASASAERNRRREGEVGQTLERAQRLRRRHHSHADATYGHFLDEVKAATALSSREDAATALFTTLEAICRRIPPVEARHLLAQLPSIVRDDLASWVDGPDKSITTEVIVAELRRQLDLDANRTAKVLEGVCQVIVRHLSPGLEDALCANLPTEMRALLRRS